MILFPITITLGILVFLCLIDPWFACFLLICFEYAWLQVRKFPLLLRLKWQLFWIKHDQQRYLKLAEQIRKDIDEQVQP